MSNQLEELAPGIGQQPETTSETAAPPRQKTAKEQKREEKERIRQYRLEKRREKEAAKNSSSVRRVGTFTMGVALILTGCSILYWLLHPAAIPAFLVYFGPAILILLGCEVLYHYFRYQGMRLKYDLLSGIVCFFLICGCAGVSILPLVYEHFGPERQMTETRLEQEIYDICYERLQNRNDIAGLHVNVYLEGVTYDKMMTVSDIAAFDYVDMRVRMKNQYHAKEQFAAACLEVLQTINGASVPYRHLHFETADGGLYSLSFNQDKFSQRLSLEELTQQVETAELSEQ